MDPKQLKKAAAAVAKTAAKAAEDHTAQAAALAGQIDALKLQHSSMVIEARRNQARAEAVAILARLADSDLLPVVLGEREPTDAEVQSLVRRGLMWQTKGHRYEMPARGWLPCHPVVVALYRELTATPTTTEDR